MVLDNSALNNLKNQCEQLKPGTEYVIKMTQQELNKQFKDAIQKTGCDIKQGKNGKIIIVKKQKEEDPLAGWGDVDADMKKIDEKTHKEAEQAKKQAEQAKKEAEQAKKQAEQAKKEAEQAKKELKQKKEYLALTNYEKDFTITLVKTLKGIQEENISTKKIITNLKYMKKLIDIGNIMTSEKDKKEWIDGLQTIQMMYKKDKTINNLINEIKNKLNSYKIDTNYVS